MKLIRVIAAAVLVLALTACGAEQKIRLVCADAAGTVAFVSPDVSTMYYNRGVYTWDDEYGVRYRYAQPQGWSCACIRQNADKPVEATR